MAARFDLKYLVLEFLGCLTLGFVMGGGVALADWKTEWNETLRAAGEEGQINIYMSRNEGVVAAFEKKYPQIKVFTVTGSGLTQRIIAERRAKKYIVDVTSGGVQSLYLVGQGLLPYLSWLPGHPSSQKPGPPRGTFRQQRVEGGG